VVTTKNPYGFTLIELVLSLALMGLVLTVALTLFSICQKAYDKEDVRLYAQQNARQAFLWLSTALRQAKNVEILSEKEIKIINSNEEQTTFYFENGVLYRRRNTGTNPIAELSDLKFFQSEIGDYIRIQLSVNTTSGDITIETKVTPFGFWINNK